MHLRLSVCKGGLVRRLPAEMASGFSWASMQYGSLSGSRNPASWDCCARASIPSRNAVGRHLIERETARLEAQLQQARRMETVGALASGIAHNFNNILGYVEIAEGLRPS